jgi:acid phosphatase type 7
MPKKHSMLCILTAILLNSGYAQLNSKSTTPERIILNLSVHPATSMAVTWRTIDEVKSPIVQIAQATNWIEFVDKAKNIRAKTEKILLENNREVSYYSAVMDSLEPNTLYTYRVGADSEWSEWNQFTTAEEKPDPFKFVFFGDPQNDIKEHVSRVFREAFIKVPDARFWLFSGDITSEPEDEQMEEVFDAAGFVFRMVPSILVPGNHDNLFKTVNGKIVLNEQGKRIRTKILPQSWRAQFTLPENGISGLEESSYYIDYQGARFIMLNSNDRLQEQAAWMERILLGNPNKWTIVSFHHPLYSFGEDRDERETRNTFLPYFDKYNVDLVLNGHDHVYARSYKLKAGKKVRDDEPGTVYVVSVSGPKMYEMNSHYVGLMGKVGVNVQLFQVIEVSDNKLKYAAYTPAGSLYDSFELKK